MKKEKEKKKKREKHALQPEPVTQSSAEPEGLFAPIDPDIDPMEYLLTEIGGKWKLRILWALRSGESLRYGDIRKQTRFITDMMLSQSLRELTQSGLVTRRQFQQIPPRVEYQITPEGAGLVPAMELLCAWAYKRIKVKEG
jgi:DNA-binding HxlR family transcriptional regulator